MLGMQSRLGPGFHQAAGQPDLQRQLQPARFGQQLRHHGFGGRRWVENQALLAEPHPIDWINRLQLGHTGEQRRRGIGAAAGPPPLQAERVAYLQAARATEQGGGAAGLLAERGRLSLQRDPQPQL